MRSVLSDRRVHQPRSLREALAILADRRADPPLPIAGGTDVMVLLNAGTLPRREFLDMGRLGELRGISQKGGTLRIGAMTSYTEIRRSPVVRKWLPILQDAAAVTGAVQIQNRGTLGGNIANASPAGDSLPVLLAAEAEVVLQSVRGTRRVPFSGFYTGYRRTVMKPDELIVEVLLSRDRLRGRRMFFRKVGTRRAQAISKVVMAGIARLRRGVVEDIRLGWGSVGPVPLRSSGTEAYLRGRRLSEETLAAARERLQQDFNPIDDIRSTARYRRAVAANLLDQFLSGL